MALGYGQTRPSARAGGLAGGAKAVDRFSFVVGVGEARCSSEDVAIDDDRVFEVIDGAVGNVRKAEAADAELEHRCRYVEWSAPGGANDR